MLGGSDVAGEVGIRETSDMQNLGLLVLGAVMVLAATALVIGL